jgi:hypothetical protein
MIDTNTDTIDAEETIRGTILTDPPDQKDTKPWTIKGMPEWVIGIARDAAKAKRMSMGEWLTEVIPMAAHPNAEADYSMPAVSQVPAVIRPKANPGLTEVSQIADIAKQVSTIEGLPPSVLKEAHGLLRDRLKAARQN